MKTKSRFFGFGAVAVMAALSLAAPVSAAPDGSRAVPPSRFIGTVTDFHGKYGVVVRDRTGVLRNVVLHQGTVIVPQGLRLERNMLVLVVGRLDAGTFAADEIDTPYAKPVAMRPIANTGLGIGPSPFDVQPAYQRRDPGNGTALPPYPLERPEPPSPPVNTKQ